MKKEVNRKCFMLSSCVTGIYCILCFLSAGLVAYGAIKYDLHLFSVGKMLVPIWLFNPMSVVIALLGMRKNKHRMPFLYKYYNQYCMLVCGRNDNGLFLLRCKIYKKIEQRRP